MSIDQLTQEALALPNELRFQLIEALLASFEDNIDTNIQSEWLLEAQKRRDEIRTGSVQPIPGEDALAQVREVLN